MQTAFSRNESENKTSALHSNGKQLFSCSLENEANDEWKCFEKDIGDIQTEGYFGGVTTNSGKKTVIKLKNIGDIVDQIIKIAKDASKAKAVEPAATITAKEVAQKEHEAAEAKAAAEKEAEAAKAAAATIAANEVAQKEREAAEAKAAAKKEAEAAAAVNKAAEEAAEERVGDLLEGLKSKENNNLFENAYVKVKEDIPIGWLASSSLQKGQILKIIGRTFFGNFSVKLVNKNGTEEAQIYNVQLTPQNIEYLKRNEERHFRRKSQLDPGWSRKETRAEAQLQALFRLQAEKLSAN